MLIKPLTFDKSLFLKKKSSNRSKELQIFYETATLAMK